MKSPNIIVSLLVAVFSLFPAGAAAQHSGHHPGQSDNEQRKSGGMMSHDMMAQHQKMMTQHQEMGKLLDQLVKNFSALENEKDSVLLRKKVTEYNVLLKQLQSKFQQGSGKMGMMGQMMEHSMMMQHGEQAMGFSQTQTTHHFLLKKDGGVIQVEAKDPKDTRNRDLIRTHLTHISHAFASGDFSDPLAVHDKVPDGVPVLKLLKGEIQYTLEQTPQGGRVLIKTANPQALDAIHQFLRFQIREHQTGDSQEVE
jgi:hypothetical protein